MSSTITRILTAAVVPFALIGNVDAFWRLQCEGVAGMARIDPLINKGTASGHMHTIKGSSAFSPTSTAADLLNSNCSSCQVAQDHSVYWTAGLYFQNSMGLVSAVPEVSGHLSYYKYTPLYANGVYTYPSAMPNGLQMISGDPNQRNFSGLPVPDPPQPWTGKDATQAALAQKAIGFNCLNYQAAAEPSLYRHFLPEKSFIDANCPDGLRLELLFPQCWNGELDSPNHKDHLAFPSATINGGTCPSGYDKVINQLFYETIFNTAQFAGQDGQFLISDGDPTGFGYHGDVIIAWEEGVLDQATTQCGPDNPGDIGANGITSDCPVFTINSVEEQQDCKIDIPSEIKDDNISGPASFLPGNVAIQSGPAYATEGSGSPGITIGQSASSSTVPSSSAQASISNSPDQAVNIVVSSSTTLSSSTPSPTLSASTTTLVQAVKQAAQPSPTTTSAPIAAPVANAPVGLQLSTITTKWSTDGQEAYEIVVVAEEVTITVSAGASSTSAPEKVKRREFEHQHHLAGHKRHSSSRRHHHQHHAGRSS